MNDGSWAPRGEKRPFIRRIRRDAPAGIRGDYGGEGLENALPNLTKFYGTGKGGIGTVSLLLGSLNGDLRFFY
jgi:hypothetical protein